MSSIGQLHSKANTTHLRWNCITSIAANNFQPTFIQPLRLLVMDLGWPTDSSALHLSICVPTYMHNTWAHSCTQPNKQGEWGGYHKPLRAYTRVMNDTPTECVTQCANVPSLKQNTRHHANHALSRICETKRDTTYTSESLCSTIIP